MIRIGRHIEGITINPLEYLLDDNGEIMLFGCEEEAKVKNSLMLILLMENIIVIDVLMNS